MNGAIVGFGTIAAGHATGYAGLDEISVVAVVDPSPKRREYARRSYSLKAYETMDDLLANESIDFVDICSPPNTHTEYIRSALVRDLHVLCEKPVFMPVEGGYQRLLDDIASASSTFYPCHNYKFAPILEFMERIIRSPEFGTVLSAQFRTLRSGHAVGVPEWNPHWRREPEISGGGVLRDHGPHSIYLATHLTGRTPVAVSCLTGRLRQDEYHGTEDTALLTIRCDEQTQIVLNLSWSASYRNSYYSVVGSSGAVVVENNDVFYTVRGEVIRSVLQSDFDDPSHKSWFRRMFLDFIDVVKNPHRQDALVRESMMTSLVIDSAYVSAGLGGQWVDVELP